MLKARLWFARLVTFYGLLIFGFLAYLYMIEPLEHIAMFGISASGAPASMNFLRAGPGALFSGLTITAAYGLARPHRLLACLWVVVVFNGCVVAARLLGMTVDGVTDLQVTELRDEGISWLFFLAALLLHPRSAATLRRQRPGGRRRQSTQRALATLAHTGMGR